MRKNRLFSASMKTENCNTVTDSPVMRSKRMQRTGLALLLAAILFMTGACGLSSSLQSTMNDIAPGEPGMVQQGVPGTVAGEGSFGGADGDFTKSEGAVDGAPDREQPPTAPEELGRKIIKEGSASIETTDYDKSIDNLYTMLREIKGFVESQTLQGGRVNNYSLRNASIVIRVPSNIFDETMYKLSALGTVFNQDTRGSDITDQYTDTESRVRNLKVQENRILELISKAEKIEEIVTLEGRLSDLRYQIESFENSLKNFDRLLDYSRISLQIQEVVKDTYVQPIAKTMGERISQAADAAWRGLVEGSQDFAVWAVYNMFTLAFLFLILIIVLLLVRGSKKRKIKRERKWAEKHGVVQNPLGANMQNPMQANMQNPMQTNMQNQTHAPVNTEVPLQTPNQTTEQASETTEGGDRKE